MITIKDKTFVPYISATQIQQRIEALGQTISADYKGKNPLIISVLNGAFIFSADLLRALSIDAEITFIRISSYAALQSTGNVKELLGLKENIFGREVLIIEDIVDTGETLAYLQEVFKELGPKSLKVVSLLHKPEAQKKANSPDYVGFEIPTKFVVGYGLDYDGLGRGLKEIYQLHEDS
jgi:hypoxanthine phosphoribosyltransferase